MQVSYEKLMKVLSNVNFMSGIKYKQINLIKSVVDYISAFSGGVIIPDTFFIALVGQSEWTNLPINRSCADNPCIWMLCLCNSVCILVRSGKANEIKYITTYK